MGGMGKDVYNIEKEMKYYAGKINQVDQRIEVIIFYKFLHT